MAIYKVQTNKGTYWWGTSQADWQPGFQAKFPGVNIVSATPAMISEVPGQYKTVLQQFDSPLPAAQTPAPTALQGATPAQPTAPASLANSIVDAIRQPIQQEIDLIKKLYINDPLAVDKQLADNSLKLATDKFAPEYARKLGEFVNDVGIKLNSFDTKDKLISELSTSTSGIAGTRNRLYQQASDAAKQGLDAAGTFFSGLAQSTLGKGAVNRSRGLDTTATNIQRQKTQFDQTQNETIASQALRETNKALGSRGLLSELTNLEAYPPSTMADANSSLSGIINRYTPYLQGGNVSLPQPPEFSREVAF